ncbi:MAG: hypothetical protein EOO03_11760 [Chitinophagaceae bacterium]|nr:MAG: hypothetical protein EOO03_11760 [Chitinophagaceae bacterium]
MNIITDVEEMNAREGNTMHTRATELAGIKDFFSGALQELKPAMEKEEAGRDCKLLIHILPPMEQWNLPADKQDQGLRMTLQGYSDELAIQIHQAISGIVDASMEKIIPGQSPN